MQQEATAVPPDNRIAFLSSFILKTLRLKPEKWNRVMSTEEYKSTVMEFLSFDTPNIIVFILTQAAHIIPITAFPLAQLKTKGVYFVKRYPAPVPKEIPNRFLIMGDLGTKPIDQLAAVVDEVFVPLLTNPLNYQQWPAIIAHDIQAHVHSLRSTVYQVKGQVSGQTVLPMPVGIEKVEEVANVLNEGGELQDLFLKSSIEGVIIKWAQQINDVLIEDSSEAAFPGSNNLPFVEIQFWNNRYSNLFYIYEQFCEQKVKCMSIILEKTKSAYFPCFREMFKNIVAALAEAKDIKIYLKPLTKTFQQIQEIDFSDTGTLIKILLHLVCLVWSNSKYYCQSSKIIILLKQICNLIIHQATRYLDPASLFQTDIDEAMLRLKTCLKILNHFKIIYADCNKKMPELFKDREPEYWTFEPITVFERFDKFVIRLSTIQEFFYTVLEFTKLEKVEIGGIKGRILSGRVTQISIDFQNEFTDFINKCTDVLDPDDDNFMENYEYFKERVVESDLKLAAILCEAFDDCCNLESIFKLIEIVGSVLDRSIIRNEFTAKYTEILVKLEEELKVTEILFDEQLRNLEKYGRIEVSDYMPPVAGALRWTNQIFQRIHLPFHSFKILQHPINTTPKALELFRRYDIFVEKLQKFKQKLFTDWTESLSDKIECYLKQPLLVRKGVTKQELALNLNPQVTAILREVRYINLEGHGEVPKQALKLAERGEIFRKYTNSLHTTIEWYNRIKNTTREVEFHLIKEEIAVIDDLIAEGSEKYDWNSDGNC